MKSDREQRRKARIKDGLCYTCGTTNDCFPNFIRCTACRAKQSVCRNKLRASRRTNGLCGCGQKQFAGVRCKKCWFEFYSVKLYKTTVHWQLLEAKWDAQNGLCAYTGIEMVPGKTASLDHIRPSKKGGTNELKNLQWVLKVINYMKRDVPHIEFIKTCALIASRHQNEQK